jgi:hypothetical protein
MDKLRLSVFASRRQRVFHAHCLARSVGLCGGAGQRLEGADSPRKRFVRAARVPAITVVVIGGGDVPSDPFGSVDGVGQLLGAKGFCMGRRSEQPGFSPDGHRGRIDVSATCRDSEPGICPTAPWVPPRLLRVRSLRRKVTDETRYSLIGVPDGQAPTWVKPRRPGDQRWLGGVAAVGRVVCWLRWRDASPPPCRLNKREMVMRPWEDCHRDL